MWRPAYLWAASDRTHDIARTVAFLASSGAGYITGAEIVVDGGMFAGLAARQTADDH
ncbi:SDR family oxidoreductase [Nonomuraea aurantiaca]|uniref:SDR family oxidoreductase n=1 Tax=Nonomuraea aurantiaca TaxID=2878562 RepID=UPI003556B45D